MYGNTRRFDFESFKKEAIAGLYAGTKITVTDGGISPMMKHFLESIGPENWSTTFQRVN